MKAMSSMMQQAVVVGGKGAKTGLPLRCAGQDGAVSSDIAAGERQEDGLVLTWSR